MRITKRIVMSVLACSFFIETVLAFRGPFLTVESINKRSSVIFTGKVLLVEKRTFPGSKDSTDLTGEYWQVTMRVMKTWKGKAKDEIKIVFFAPADQPLWTKPGDEGILMASNYRLLEKNPLVCNHFFRGIKNPKNLPFRVP